MQGRGCTRCTCPSCDVLLSSLLNKAAQHDLLQAKVDVLLAALERLDNQLGGKVSEALSVAQTDEPSTTREQQTNNATNPRRTTTSSYRGPHITAADTEESSEDEQEEQEKEIVIFPENMDLLSSLSKARVRVWTVLSHATEIVEGKPKGFLPKGKKVYYLAHLWDDRHYFQPNLYCAVNSLTSKLYFRDDIDPSLEAEGYEFHCQYYTNEDKTEYFDFRVAAAKGISTKHLITSRDEWEEYFTVIQRYPRSSAFSTDEIEWEKEVILALHCGCDKAPTLYDFMKKYDLLAATGTLGIEELKVVGSTCEITWFIDKSENRVNPVAFLRLPACVTTIITHNKSILRR